MCQTKILLITMVAFDSGYFVCVELSCCFVLQCQDLLSEAQEVVLTGVTKAVNMIVGKGFPVDALLLGHSTAL